MSKEINIKRIAFIFLFLCPLISTADWKGDLYDLVTVYSGGAKDASIQFKAIEDKLAHGADPNVKEEDTPVIFKALKPDQLKVLELLIKNKADVNGRDRDGYTPLMRAAFSTATFHPQDLSVIKTLLNYKADPNLSDKNSMTPLHLAAANLKPEGGTGLVELLLKSGANPNIVMGPNKAQFGFSPMSAAARKGNNAVIKVLAQAKADPNLKRSQGISPLTAAKQSGHPESAKLIESLGGRE